jgi:hypothetical protein
VRSADRRRVRPFLLEAPRGRGQVYFVSPRVEAGDDIEEAIEEDAGSAEAAMKRPSRGRRSRASGSSSSTVACRLPSAREARALPKGEAKVLVATTVIEVGVDVPAATVMVVENAERLGLAQLHQLRGRVARAEGSWCLLFGKESALERLTLLERTSDGFEIAEEDLRRRGWAISPDEGRRGEPRGIRRRRRRPRTPLRGAQSRRRAPSSPRGTRQRRGTRPLLRLGGAYRVSGTPGDGRDRRALPAS